MRLIAQCCAAVMTAALITLPAAAAQAEPAATPDSATLPEALKRDLDITPAEATARQQKEQAGVPVAEELRTELDGRFGGSWFDKGKLKVGVTDDAAAKAVRDKGAEPVPVARSEKALDDTKSALDGARNGTEAVHSWYVDPTSNTVVVTAASEQAGREFAAKAGVEGSVRVTTGHEMKPAHDLRGGDQYVINGNTLCSVGFPVNGGFVTAGHCGGTGSTTKGFNNVNQGTFAGSSFPGQDYAWVRTNGDWASKPWVNNYSGGNVVVAGSQEAGVGATICRSGRTTGWRCGTIQAKNVTVNYGGRIVNGLVSTTACAEGGDSGGAVLSGNQAQGVTSGAGGNCSNGGTSVYQPLKPILSAYGLTLTTNGGGGSGTKIIGHQNRCVDVPNSNAKDGQRLQVWDCNGTNAQNWTFAGDGTVRAFGMCMDVAWGSRDNGAAIQLATCSGNPAQQFVLSGAGDLVNPQANKCVDITGSWGSGSALQQWECTGKSNQKWRKG
ncbi:ricin-type beta-trefoil lectin domain protein [Actinosynnema pretiosum subsp. pretiosum]|uniref:Ricin B lectin n=2 Tax=Actinosynnema TaxID=40566 RepID=C6WE55_ACTMD|nr:ricin-type beta-trefoil lectin domain protein [Actinosynnema mirum]ACU35798.1 Ricin B lectin [Actinosynnema mirum DSM 43827]AXX29223.1 Streptogrisin-C precursor [Actinosynnema pretiosum subsp. pretiosum]QUF06511.1 ricin-type beta-trefoil lectin domain protein [Actinosynnema pretiosum subsp. pretiosum]